MSDLGQTVTNLSAETVHVWCYHISGDACPTERLWKMLSPQENARAKRFVHDQHRLLYIHAHAALNGLLSRYLNSPIEKIEQVLGSHQKPEIPGNPIHFNLSHSGCCVLIALSQDSPIGVDVEKIALDRSCLELAERYFHPSEHEAVRGAIETNMAVETFYKIWTRKEAYIKALGEGLSRPLDSFTVPIPPETEGCIQPLDALEPRAHFQELNMPDGYVGSVAHLASFDKILQFELTEIPYIL